MRLTIAPYAIVIATVLTTAGSFPVWAETAAATESAGNADLPAITITTVTKHKVEDHVLASGLIAPVEQVSVVPLIEGQPIETLAVDVGDTVKAGQVLATLSTATLTLSQSQLQASLVSAKSSATDAKKTADRSASLLAAGSTSTAANDQNQSALTAANAQLAAVQSQLDNLALQIARTQVVAPVAGLITARNAQMGTVASAAGQPMFVITRDGALELRADVAEADLPRVMKDQKATITLAAAIPGLTGRVALVEPSVNVTTRLGRARITINKPELVRTGMYAEADILIVSHDALAVPVTSVGSEGTESTVMLVKDGIVHRTTVTTGIRDGGWVEILTGLTAGDTIVAKAGAFVADGDKINPISSATN